MEKYERECPECGKVLTYLNKYNLKLAIEKGGWCSGCRRTGYKHPEKVEKICEWCQKPYEVIWKKRKQEFCSKSCMYEWRKNKTQKEWIEKTEIVKCLECKKPFRRLKEGNKYRNDQLQLFCSNECNRSSEYKKEKLRKWGLSDANPRKTQKVKNKIKRTNLKRHGSETYNNPQKNMETTMERYGVPYGFMKNPSNGKRISKGQRELYDEIKKEHKDALLEHWLPDMQKSVDIFIPSENKIVEYYGRYWHADPNKYPPDYYHKIMKMTAEEIWKKDGDRERELMGAGYELQIEWEKGK